MTFVRTGLAAAALLAVGLTGVSAQDAQAPRDPNMPAPQNTIPEKIAPSEPETTGSTAPSTAPSLSDKLQATDGVIKPPDNVAPSMQVAPPVPDPGTTRVIPPPGTPGGDPTIRPK